MAGGCAGGVVTADSYPPTIAGYGTAAASDIAAAAGRRPWTPLNQALDRFLTRAHRFPCEKLMDQIAPSLAELAQRLRAGGQGIQELLSPDFRGLSVVPGREARIELDSAFRVFRGDWSDGSAGGTRPLRSGQALPLQQAAEFTGALGTYLAPHAPLTLADLFCVAISGAPDDHPVTIKTRLRFELGAVPPSVAPLYERRPDNSDAGPFQGRLRPALRQERWQASGIWELDWARGEAGWKIAAWQPVEMTVVEGPATVFTDVTESAFARDPTYPSHLQRDINYWRAVLDKASGIDIFGNSGVSVGDADGDGRDEIYLCQPQGLPNRLYRQITPGQFEDVARQAGVDLLDNTSMALFADVLNRGHQDLIVITETSPLLFLNDGRGRFTLKRDAFPPALVQAALTGAAMADYDRDGFLDLYVCAYGYVEGEDSTLPCPYYDAQNGPPNRLFQNQGDGTFIDVTAASGLDRSNDRFSFACAWNDVDGDGWPDLAVVNDFGRNNFYRNLGGGKFEEVAGALPGSGSGMSAAFADFDGDGRAELYVSNMWVPAGERVTAEAGFADRFKDLPRDQVREFAMGNALYSVVPSAVVTTSVVTTNVATSVAPSSVSTFSVATPSVAPSVAPSSVAPLYERRGRTDAGHRPALQQAGPDAGHRPALQPTSFRLAPDAAGARRGRWAWSADAIDLENNGRLDIYVVNGYLSGGGEDALASLRARAADPVPLDAYLWEEVVALSPHTSKVGNEYRAAWSAISQLAHQGYAWNGNERNVMFVNLGNGRFEDVSAVSGLDFREDGRAFAVFDFDGDGDADLVVRNRTGTQLRLLRNDLANSNRSFALRLTGVKSNRDAIGARIEIETPGGRQVRFLGCGSGFLSQHSKELVIGLGRYGAATRVRVHWPSGDSSEQQNLEAGYRYFLVEGEPSARREPLLVAASSPAAAPLEAWPERERRRVGPADDSGAGPDDAGHRPALQTALQRPDAAATARFSTSPVEPLPVLLPDALRGSRLLWLWDPASRDTSALDALLRVQDQIPSTLVVWNGETVPSAVSSSLVRPPWRADERFRLFCSTLLAHLYDYQRPLVFPTGLLFEHVSIVAASAAAALEARPERERRGAGHRPALQQAALQQAALQQLVKIYWGGAESAEILRDASNGVASGQKALPFPGRAILCSFSRDFRTLGAALATAGLYPEAELYSARAVDANPRDADALYNLAIARERQGKIAAATEAARGALQARPEFPQANNLLGVLLSESGRDEESRPLFEKATKAMPDFVEAWNNLGYLELKQNNLAGAEAALEQALQLAPEYAEALNNLGILRARQKQPDQAEELFRRALALEPDNEKAANNLAVVKVSQRKPQEAAEILQRLLERHPDQQSTLLNLARLDVMLAKNTEARQLLEGWLARHPDDQAVRKLLDNVR